MDIFLLGIILAMAGFGGCNVDMGVRACFLDSAAAGEEFDRV
ncbi:hypothetical protein TcasGA2_TC032673 [Tribolium castaneum]|uniref:Uncharacterized protein n=1 Tax=Tribolium castaneum TaxID=7070 RepID=A0A139WK01_TRICA|nr:hypothetical protein TcasGA2_TC032673 [Tribolium castaneum]